MIRQRHYGSRLASAGHSDGVKGAASVSPLTLRMVTYMCHDRHEEPCQTLAPVSCSKIRNQMAQTKASIHVPGHLVIVTTSPPAGARQNYGARESRRNSRFFPLDFNCIIEALEVRENQRPTSPSIQQEFLMYLESSAAAGCDSLSLRTSSRLEAPAKLGTNRTQQRKTGVHISTSDQPPRCRQPSLWEGQTPPCTTYRQESQIEDRN